MTNAERREAKIERLQALCRKLDVLIEMRAMGFSEEEAQAVYSRLKADVWTIADADAYIVRRLAVVEGAV